MKFNQIFLKCLFNMVLIWTMGTIVGCSDNKEDLEQTQYGYVQFNILKSASYDDFVDSRALDKLNFLNDAKKVEVVLQRNGETISQTLVLNSYNKENAEFGLRSDKLRLLVGEYSISGYHFYDSLDKLILSGETDDNLFTVVN